jgi:adenylyltransferase/sulfurtransferase
MPAANPILLQTRPEGRYDRQAQISWWDQKKLSQTQVIVAGAGALGNEVLKLLALTGIGRITVVDFDRVSPSNLARTVLFRQGDIGRPKVEAAVERLGELNPEVAVRGVQGDLRFDLSLGDYREADLVFGCVDSVNARWALNRKCLQAGVEWIDGGISDYHGQVARYSPEGGACYECNFTARTLERFNQRYSCPYGLLSSQAGELAPTTAITTSAIAALQVQQALLTLHGIGAEALQPGERLMLFLKPFGLIKDHLPANPGCLAHDTLPEHISLLPCTQESSLEEVLAAARAIHPEIHSLALSYDLVTRFVCPACGAEEAVNRPKEKVFQEEAVCPRCGGERRPEILDRLPADSPYRKLRLREIGIPGQEILAFQTNSEQMFLKLQ